MVLSTRTGVAEEAATLGGMSSALIVDLGNRSSSMLSLTSFLARKKEKIWIPRLTVYDSFVCVYMSEKERDRGVGERLVRPDAWNGVKTFR